MDKLQLPVIFFGGISVVCSLLDAFVFTPSAIGLLTIIPWGITALLGLILVGGALYNSFIKK